MGSRRSITAILAGANYNQLAFYERNTLRFIKNNQHEPTLLILAETILTRIRARQCEEAETMFLQKNREDLFDALFDARIKPTTETT